MFPMSLSHFQKILDPPPKKAFWEGVGVKCELSLEPFKMRWIWQKKNMKKTFSRKIWKKYDEMNNLLFSASYDRSWPVMAFKKKNFGKFFFLSVITGHAQSWPGITNKKTFFLPKIYIYISLCVYSSEIDRWTR